MPEIKNQFTGGKMNKDLDERLIPKGEYRDAMNIQVSTSEGSSVGTVQNILGNTLGCTDYVLDPSSNPIPSGSFTVGSISDEKDDSLYWLISGESYSADNMVGNNDWDGGVVTMKDLILKKGPNKCEPVFVDKFAFSQPYVGSINSDTLSGIDLSIINQIQPGWTVTGVADNGDASNTSTIVSLGDIQSNYIPVEFESTVVTTPININSYVGNSPHAVASGILIPMYTDKSGSTYFQDNSNVVYMIGFNGTPSTLVGDTIDILPYHTTPQTFTISNAITVVMTFPGGYVLNVIKVTLDSNLTSFTGPPIDQPSPAGAGASVPHSATANGSVIDAIITSQDILNLNIATGELTIDINYFNVSAIAVDDTVYKDNTAYCVESKDTINNSITLKDCNTGAIHDGWQVGGSIYDVLQPIGGAIIIQSQIQVQLDTNIDLSNATYTSLLYRGPRTLNFDHNNYITGINIIDDMLFWTDGKTEPKKINIPRSIQGSKIPGTTPGFEHTRLINEPQGISIWDNVPVREEHITVIRKAPLSAPSINFETTARESVVGGFNVVFTENFANSIVGETINITASNNTYGFLPGDIIRLSEELVYFPSFDLRAQVIEIDNYTYTVKVLSISPNADVVNVNSWYAELEPIGSFLFERKLPRFAYRYKYLDNEYSSFSPFTNVAFYPGDFNYEPVKAYNKGMANTIESLAITGFITPDIPKDVASIDLLYKNETSPIIYLVDTVSNKDELINGKNSWNSTGNHNLANSNSGYYNITNENIAQALPSNQSLRSWDNVPKKALAQEVSGNRVIYGNYVQGYDIKNDNGKNITPDINLSVRSNTIDTSDNSAKKSIKSLRNYEVGVVWGDKYGRETPVVASKSGSILVPKNKSKTSNHLNVSLNSSPRWSDYYRFYVKETSNEYYNLAVDRVYDASDGGIWVSFPSVDRNKIDEDTYIILKKGVDSEGLVDQEARYKVVAIENEAPEYIKTSYDLIVRSNQDDTHSTHSCNFWGGSNYPDQMDSEPPVLGAGCTAYPGNSNYANESLNPPIVGRKSFSISNGRWGGEYSTTNKYMGLPSLITLFNEVTSNSETVNNEMYVSFTKETESGGVTNIQSGDKYRVIDVVHEGIVGTSPYIIHLETPIGVNDDFVAQDSGHSTNGVSLQADGIHVIFWQKSVTNKPEFDGRFFVKILSDQATEKHLSRAKSIFNSWRTTDLDIYRLEDDNLASNSDNDYNWSSAAVPTTPAVTFDPDDSDYGSLNQAWEWEAALKFGGPTLKAAWFIDNAPFAGRFSNSGGTYQTEFNNGTTDYDSCDLASTLPDFTYTNDQGTIYTVAQLQSYFSTFNVDGTAPTNSLNIGTGISLGRLGMKGFHTKNGSNYIDLSYSILSPNAPLEDGGTTWDVGNPNTNTSTDDQEHIVSKLTEGTRFKLKNGNVIYKILGVEKFRLLNYMGVPSILMGPNAQGGTNIMEVPFTETGYNGAGEEIGSNSGYFSNVENLAQIEEIKKPQNKRATYRIRYEIDMLSSPVGVSSTVTLADEEDAAGNDAILASTGTVFNTIQFLEEVEYEGENKISSNPAIFETEPKEDVGLDLYYEASSSLPVFPLTNKNKFLFIPIGTTIVPPTVGDFPDGIFITGWSDITPTSDLYVNLSTPITQVQYAMLALNNGRVEFLRDDGTYVTATIADDGDVTFYGIAPNGTTSQLQITPSNEFGLSWHNCWSFNNGVESNRIGDTYNKPYLSNGVTLSTTAKDSPGQEIRNYGLIYSGIYNSNSGVNSLNQFIAAEKITKDINPTYGSIQKLYAGWGQGGDLVALCEDRVLKILANKDALYNADGNSNVTSTNNVLGQTIPYSGEYGISKNPESFASEAYRAYFTDKVRGTVMRLSMDGLTPISAHGMKDWFRDNLKLSSKLVGSYDSRKSEYNLTLKGDTIDAKIPFPTTVSFKEDVKGWVSFKSFVPENAISCANEYYTFKDGNIWKHHDEAVDRNTFYTNFKESSINVILNESPGTIKTFHTLNYEGTQSKVNTFTDYNTYTPGTNANPTNIYNNEYYNLGPDKPGWKVLHIQTDQEEGSLNEFIEKEGKWFNYIRGKAGSVTDGANITSGFNNADFSFQGIGTLSENATSVNTVGCMNDSTFVDGGVTYNTYSNYDSNAAIPGSCTATVLGCTDPTAVPTSGDGYNPLANTDDGSCVYYGCTDANATNYDSNATTGSANFPCTYDVYGCTDSSTDANGVYNMLNFDISATQACDGINGNFPNFSVPVVCVGGQAGSNCCCVTAVYGCMDPLADNYNCNGSCVANVQQVSSIDLNNPCFYTIPGCTDATSCEYNALANQDDGSCNWCNISTANNYDGLGPGGDPYSCDSGCLYCKQVSNLQQIFGGPSYDTIDISWDETWNVADAAAVDHYDIRHSVDAGATWITITNVQPLVIAGTVYHAITGLSSSTTYLIEVQAICSAGTSPLNPTWNTSSIWSAQISVSTQSAPVYGCTDPNACNPTPGATVDDGSCEYITCAGCTDPLACNQTTGATMDDGSCLYPAANADCSGACLTGFILVNGSCVAEVLGCMDDSLNNSGSHAATNYNSSANVDDGSCTYIMPTLYNAVPLGMQAPLLATNGWTTTTLWGGNTRVVFAVWDVSSSPAIDKNNLQFAYENSAGSNAGDITNFTSQISWWYSVNDGASWSSGNGFTNGDNIQLIRFRFSSHSGVVEFLPSATKAALYPPTASNGAQQQAAKIGFTNTNIPTHTTNVETYNVMLGCNDSNAWAGYNDEIPFFDNTLCELVGVIDNTVVSPAVSTAAYGAWYVTQSMQWDYTANTPGDATPDNFEIEAVFTQGDGQGPNAADALAAYSTNTSTHPPYTGSNPEGSIQDPTLVSQTDPTGRWMRFRVRAVKTVNTTLQTGPWVETWSQV